MNEKGEHIYKQVKELLFFLGLLCFSIGLPVSKTVMTIGGIVLAVHFFLDRKLLAKFKRVASNKLIWPFVAFYILHIIGIIYSEDLNYALTDVRVKLPILFLPIFLSEAPHLEKKKRQSVLVFFILTLVFGTILGFYNSLDNNVTDPRQIITFNSHIRFSIMLAFGLFLLSVFVFSVKMRLGFKLFLSAILLWMIYFLFFKGALTGRIIALSTLFIILFVFVYQSISRKWFYLILISFAVGFVALLLLAKSVSEDYMLPKENIELEQLPLFTENGHPYQHTSENKILINGYHLGWFLCEEEIRGHWGKLSDVSLDFHFETGTSLYDILLRYLTSKGLHKDKNGLQALTQEDILKIEAGIENVKLESTSNFKSRFYGVLWGYQHYKHYHYSRGNSLMQRFELWNLGFQSFKKHPFLGVGTGDAVLSFNELREETNSSLEGTHLRTHNQFLAVLVALGIPGLLLFLWMVFFPPAYLKLWENRAFLVFQIIFLLSLFTENTLETQVGASFFAFFSSYFIFMNPRPLKFN